MIEFRRNGSVVLTDDADGTRTQTLSVAMSQANKDAAIAAFFGPYVPKEPTAWGEITPRQIVAAMLIEMKQAGIMTQAQQDAVATGVIERLKR